MQRPIPRLALIPVLLVVCGCRGANGYRIGSGPDFGAPWVGSRAHVVEEYGMPEEQYPAPEEGPVLPESVTPGPPSQLLRPDGPEAVPPAPPPEARYVPRAGSDQMLEPEPERQPNFLARLGQRLREFLEGR